MLIYTSIIPKVSQTLVRVELIGPVSQSDTRSVNQPNVNQPKQPKSLARLCTRWLDEKGVILILFL